MQYEPIPRLPVFGWQALSGAKEAQTPCFLSLPELHFSTSGRASILLVLQALGVGPGDVVLLPTYHCPTMVSPAIELQAQPMFYALDDKGTPDLAWLSQQDLGRVRVLLAAHYFGLPQPMARIKQWCHARGIALIEDCAHALFGRSDGQAIGSWGDAAIGSLTKFLPVPEGGCFVLNKAVQAPPLTPVSLGTKLKAWVDVLQVGAAQQRLPGLNGLINGGLSAVRWMRGGAPLTQQPPLAFSSPPEIDLRNEEPGSDYVLDVPLARRELSPLCRQLAQHLPRQRIVTQRRQHYTFLQQRTSGFAGLRPLMPTLPADCAPYVFPLWVEHPDPGYLELRRLGMPVFRWDRVWPGVPHLPADHGLRWSHHVLQLACHQDMTQADLEMLVAQVLLACKAHTPADAVRMPVMPAALEQGQTDDSTAVTNPGNRV
jgi:perosamine synthetase